VHLFGFIIRIIKCRSFFLIFLYWIALAAIYYYFSLSCVNMSNICLGVKISVRSDRHTDSWTDTKREGLFHNPEKIKELTMFCLCWIIVE